jgi:polyhydroxyalkanoate synthesis regulator phasin
MYEDLETIVRLEFGKKIDAISQQTRANIQDAENRFAAATRGAVIRSGQHDASLGRIRINGAEELVRSLFEIWVNIIVERNGYVARGDVDFIAGMLVEVSRAQIQNLLRAFTQQGGGVSATLSQEAQHRMDAAVARARRDLEIMVRKNEVLPKKPAEKEAVIIQYSNIGNLNLGSQVGTINAALKSISSGSGNQQEFAQALKDLTEAVVSQQALTNDMKLEVVQALTTVAAEATKKPEERSTGTLKAIIGYLPGAISSVSQLTELWGKLGPTIKGYLGIG